MPENSLHFSQPSLRDVADAAGVSRSSAQRALANSPHIAEKTRLHVQKVAENLGYRPQPVIAAMGARSRRKLAGDLPLVYLYSSRSTAGTSYHEDASARAASLGYKLDGVDLDRLEKPERLWDILYARGYAGVLVGGMRREHHNLLMKNTRFPVVCCGRTDPLPYHTVRPAILQGLKTAFDTMVGLGYRRIGVAVMRHSPKVEDDFSRRATAMCCVDELPKGHAKIPPLECDMSGDGVVDWVREHRPDAVLAFHEGIAFLIRDAGYRIPKEIGFASLHRGPKAEFAGLDNNFEMIAIAAVNLMDQLIRHGESGIPENPLTIMVESRWVDSPSMPRKRATAHGKKGTA
jgi:DNA-binding LacI/PurR family transcriptional regulator